MPISHEKQQEWATWKYFVMAHSQYQYTIIRQLFSGNDWTPAKEQAFQLALATAKQRPPTIGSLRNTYQHVWGYFKRVATPEEKANFQARLAQLSLSDDSVKPLLQELAIAYEVNYLLASRLLFVT